MTATSERYDYASGYKTRSRAEIALEHALASGDIMEGEFPLIESYRIGGIPGRGEIRYKITLR